MLTRLTIRNLKRFDDVDIELGNPVVFIGPNNSGKTTALQALALWDIGLRRWLEKYSGKPAPRERTGVTINRRDLLALPVPHANLLWRNLRMRAKKLGGQTGTQNILIEVAVEGVAGGRVWACPLEFDYANPEFFYCRPVRRDGAPEQAVPLDAGVPRIAFLPPMSGLAAEEPKWEPGRINVLIGEGQTAQVLRNLCYGLATEKPDAWNEVKAQIERLFGDKLEDPLFLRERGEVALGYRDRYGARLDLSSSGRGLQQTLLLLSYMYSNPGAVVLLDEPDAHLEILRQRQTYQLLTDVARDLGSQVIAASHSEVLLNEAAKDTVIAFIGTPHRIDSSRDEVRKALAEFGWEHYMQAEQTGWVLYLEGSSDLAVLRSFAQRLTHPAVQALERPFVHYVANQPVEAKKHFFALREACPKLKGIALFDRLEKPLSDVDSLLMVMWRKREIENYLCFPEVLREFAASTVEGAFDAPLFAGPEMQDRQERMRECCEERILPVALANRGDAWWSDVKASDDFLDKVLASFFSRLDLPNLMAKRDYHDLVRFIPGELIDDEVREKLDAIAAVAAEAQPAE
jgi:hypothetical protein